MKLLLALCCVLWAVTCFAQTTALRPDQISPGTPDITWQQVGPGYQIGSTIPWRTESGTTFVTAISAADNAKTIEVTNVGAVSTALPDVTGTGLTSGFGFTVQTAAGTLTLSGFGTQKINGQGSIKIGAYQLVSLASRGGNWYATFSMPQPSAQTGGTILCDTMTWSTSCTAVAGPPTGHCAEATNFFARVWGSPVNATLDGTVGATVGTGTGHVGAYDAMICGLVSDGVWPLLDALWFMATDAATGSARAVANLNLVSSSYTLVEHPTPGTSPAFTANAGYTGVAASSTVYLDTQFNPQTNGVQYALNSASHSAWILNNTSHANQATGAYDGTNITATAPISSGSTFCTVQTTGAAQGIAGTVLTNSIGLLFCNRSTVSAAQIYYGSTAQTVAAQAGTGAKVNVNLWFLALNANGTVNGSPYQIGVSHVGGNFNATKEGQYYTRVCTALTAVHGSC